MQSAHLVFFVACCEKAYENKSTEEGKVLEMIDVLVTGSICLGDGSPSVAGKDKPGHSWMVTPSMSLLVPLQMDRGQETVTTLPNAPTARTMFSD